MGNCVPRGFNEDEGLMIRVATCNGGVMELHPPVTAECITNGFPGHAIFRSRAGGGGGGGGGCLLSPPLLHNEELLCGELYYLRPLHAPLAGVPSLTAPYRVSFDHHGLWRRHHAELLPAAAAGGGVWKVKLVISPAQLAEILAQESRTEALMESVRTVAKCGTGAASSAASSDQWSLASSRKVASEY